MQILLDDAATVYGGIEREVVREKIRWKEYALSTKKFL